MGFSLFNGFSATRALQLFQVMRLGAVVLTSILLAKSGLGTAEIGAYEMLLYIGTTLSFFWVNGLLMAMPTVHSNLGQEDRKAFFFNVFLVFTGISAGLFLLLLAGENAITPLLTGKALVPHFGLFCVYLLFNLPSYPVEYFYLLQEKPANIVAWGAVTFSLHVAALFIPVWAGYGLQGGFEMLVVLSVGKFIWTAVLVARSGVLQWRPDLLRDYLRFSAPLTLNVLLGNFILMFDAWLVGWHYGDEAIFAIFRYGSREFPLATALATALGTALIPLLTEKPEEGLYALKDKSLRLMHLLFPLTIVLLFLTRPLFPLVFNPDFAASAPLFNIYLLMTASRVLLPNAVVLARGAPNVIFRVGLIELAVKVTLGFLFIRYWGLPGVAWSAVLAFWVEKAGLIWYLESRCGVPTHEWLSLRWYFLYTTALLAAFIIA